MFDIPNDTKPEAEKVLIELLRRAPMEQKLCMVGQMHMAVREFALAGLRLRFPTATEEQLRRRLADLLLGSELAAKVYGPIEEYSADAHRAC